MIEYHEIHCCIAWINGMRSCLLLKEQAFLAHISDTTMCQHLFEIKEIQFVDKFEWLRVGDAPASKSQVA